MTNKVYEKQLEKFGIEATVLPTRTEIKKKREEEDRAATNIIIKQLMDTPAGRQWLYSILDMCGVFSPPFAPGEPDVTGMLCGLQMVGHKFLADIMIGAPEQFYVMNQEAISRKAMRKQAQPD